MVHINLNALILRDVWLCLQFVLFFWKLNIGTIMSMLKSNFYFEKYNKQLFLLW